MEREINFQSDFSADEFRQRRQRVMDHIGNDIAIFQGMPATGAFDLFRQHNDFYYLCGVEVPHAYLLIDGHNQKSFLYLPARDEKHERSEGAVLTCDDVDLACKLAGVDDVCNHDLLAQHILGASTIHLSQREPEARQACQDTLRHARQSISGDPWDQLEPSPERFKHKIAQHCPSANFTDISPLLTNMRLFKSDVEIAVMRRAGELTGQAVTEAMRCTKAGVYEYQLAAVADLIFNAGGAWGGGYRPIIACGSNIWNAHYFQNQSCMQNGQLVLMDYAPDLRNYTSDIGRMWPVNGTFSNQQRELYGFIVEYHKILLSLVRPGVMADQIYREAEREAQPIVEATAWSKPIYREAAERVLSYDRHLTHPVGMAVHDVGEYRDEPLQPGIVFALDPQMWVPEEQLYIRVEDTVLITESGIENLTPNAPLELDDVEQVMTEPGVYDVRPHLLHS